RAGGKHNDLEDVGRDTYHHTFFEMLGSWSFGDYFKEEAIRWAWQFLHEEMGIPRERLHVTYFAGDAEDGVAADDEARQLWLDGTDVVPEHVHAFGRKDNFWEMADVGPCGPCSEIHVDLTPDLSGAPLVNADDPRVFEVWNLVFIQFDRQADRSLRTLPARHVDTGMGFERLVAVLQGKTSNYDTDVFTPLMHGIAELASAPPYAGTMPVADRKTSQEMLRDVAYRVVSDHLRCLSFAIADGALPDNEGRGYVLRRILRRAVRTGRQYLGFTDPFLHRLVPTLVDQMGEPFPELRAQSSHVSDVLLDEEQSFARTLDTGLKLFSVAADRVVAERAQGAASGDGEPPRIDGETAFRLHDTYGFPIDLTCLIAEERGLSVDVADYERRMATARELARGGGKTAAVDRLRALAQTTAARADEAFFARTQTEDAPKFARASTESEIVGWVDGEGTLHDTPLEASSRENDPDAPVVLLLRTTPFYAEQGGQVGDRGRIEGSHGGRFEVLDTQRARDTVLHIGRLTAGRLASGERVLATVDASRRDAIQANHTATHLLNLGLRRVLGERVDQRGSLVDDEKTRFDFSHRQAVSTEEVERLETEILQRLEADLDVHAAEVALEEAQRFSGLRAVFGEKYPERVRVVSIGVSVTDLQAQPENAEWPSYSIELCGGTHVSSTRAINGFRVITEEAVAKGVRRMVAVTGDAARAADAAADALEADLEEIARANDDELADRLTSAIDRLGTATLPLVRRQRLQQRVAELQERLKAARRSAAADKESEALDAARALLDERVSVGSHAVIVGRLDDAGSDELRAAIDWLRQKAGSAAVVLFGSTGPKLALLAALTPDLVEAGHDARALLRVAGKIVGGGGGGRPDFAQGGGEKPELVDEAIPALRDHLVDLLS
ncbi:MAG: alanine--tRNA ligase, partial [Acidobacteriota bacterium]